MWGLRGVFKAVFTDALLGVAGFGAGGVDGAS
jgi:hypothetical protein